MDLRPFLKKAKAMPLAPAKWIVYKTAFGGGEWPNTPGRVSPPVRGEIFHALFDSEEDASQAHGELARMNPQHSCGYRLETEDEIRWRMASELAYTPVS